MKQIVTTNWVYENIKNEKLIILDCSWHMPSENRDAYKEFRDCHIIKSEFFDIDRISDKNSKLPHMTPSARSFENEIQKIGINSDSIIVVYDSIGIFSSPRAWWLFKYFGHNKIYVMNGGLKKWIKEKKPITKKIFKKKIGNFRSKIDKSLIVNYKYILKNIHNKNIIIFDARNKKRFKGIVKEPRKNLRSGHIPNSKNLFYGDLITKKGTLITKNKIIKKLNSYKIKNKSIITSCGSGITACIVSLSLLHGKKINSKVYDGSWSEWGLNKKLPIEK